MGDITELHAKYKTEHNGIKISIVSDWLIANKKYNDDLKILFSLFLRTVLCVINATCINPMYLHTFKDVELIAEKEMGYVVLQFSMGGYKEV